MSWRSKITERRQACSTLIGVCHLSASQVGLQFFLLVQVYYIGFHNGQVLSKLKAPNGSLTPARCVGESAPKYGMPLLSNPDGS